MSAFLLMRLLLPLSLGTCVLLRQNMFSLIYLLLLFFTPFVGNPSEKNMSGLTGSYLLVVMVISILITIAQILFQILLISNQPYGYFLPNCGKMDYIIRHIGLLRLDSISPLTGIRLLTPEVIMVTSSITVYVLCYKWTRPSQTRINQPSSYFSNTNRVKFVRALGKYVSTLSLCVAGCIQPSVPGALYFLVFIGTMTLWSIHQHIGKWYTYVLCGLAVVVALHILALFAVQTQWVQEMLPRADCNYCRYFGLTILVTRDCLSPQEEEFPYKNWDSYLNPPILLGNFYILAMVSRMLCKLKVENIKPRSRLVSVRNEEEYVGITTNTPRRSATKKEECEGGIGKRGTLNHQLLENSILGDQHKHDFCQKSDRLKLSVKNISAVVKKWRADAKGLAGSMVWSITYHSWVTFVLLLWAIALCVIPNHRRRMETSSPFLVFYSVFLLLCQYLYSMDLSDMELPQEVAGINLLQLGFVKTFHYPIVHLLSKVISA
uniref:Piezo TM1-24 domain-containing protein n=1 Tax=Timema poppense TaxID=170557 RepID=A0A7R9GZC7_TIMPO|nr:unnamed protein product [Timema poppensis]